VAVTRAAFWLGCSGYWWGDGTSRLGPSAFLTEVQAACAAGAGTVDRWAPEPDPEAGNPLLAEPAAATWPAPASGSRYAAVAEAAELVTAEITALERRRRRPAEEGSRAAGTPAEAGRAGAARAADARTEASQADRGAGRAAAAALSPADQALIAGWARDTDLLLAERAQRRGDHTMAVPLPGRIPVSSLVTIARDPALFAAQVRRPMPQPPAPQARRGTAFHRWLEQRFGPRPLIDSDEILGAADADSPAGADPDLDVLKTQFENGEWADRWPAEVEVPFETLIGDRLVRGRIDAVFADGPGGGFDIVDWKTGRAPTAPDERRAVAVQLAAYRLAWAALTGVAVGQVRAAFYYVRDDLTVRPADLLDQAGLAALIEGVPLAGPGPA
jgi:DNA helicase-2/ATP-dependent DNA helicase PcrA